VQLRVRRVPLDRREDARPPAPSATHRGPRTISSCTAPLDGRQRPEVAQAPEHRVQLDHGPVDERADPAGEHRLARSAAPEDDHASHLAIIPRNGDLPRRMAELLAAHPTIDGVWTANDMMAFGAVDALAAAGRRAPVVGINGLPEAIANIERGTMLATADFSALNIAAIATRAVLRRLRGEPVPQEILVPAELIDRKNIDRWKVPMIDRPCPAWDEIVGAS